MVWVRGRLAVSNNWKDKPIILVPRLDPRADALILVVLAVLVVLVIILSVLVIILAVLVIILAILVIVLAVLVVVLAILSVFFAIFAILVEDLMFSSHQLIVRE